MKTAKIIENIQTGWVKWQKVKVSIEDKQLICESNVENLSEKRPTCIVYIQLKNKELEKIELRFYLEPNKSETVTLTKDLPHKYNSIESIEVDEE